MHEGKSIITIDKPLDYSLMMKHIDGFIEKYPFISVSFLGSSILGKSIPIIKLGEGERFVLYVGSHHGAEWMTSAILMRFINDYCELYRCERSPYGQFIHEMRTSIYVVPMLNPDGVDISINGADSAGVLKERLISMNGGSEDFLRWKANARGVDLNHNYDAGFVEYKQVEPSLGIFGGGPTKYSGEFPESEPEVGALCNYLRFNENIKAVLTLHTQGEEIYYSSGSKTMPRAESIAKYISRMCGYSLGIPTGSAAYGGLTDWMICRLARHSFTLECGKGETPLPLDSFFSIYSGLRELLFKFPELF